MNKCESCYHYEACKSCYRAANYTLGEDIKPVRCPLFEDKSLIVELPCNVSDIVYEVDGEIYELKIKKVIVSKSNVEFECFDIDSIDDAEFCLNEIGKTIFLDREDAERALEEINNEKNNN